MLWPVCHQRSSTSPKCRTHSDTISMMARRSHTHSIKHTKQTRMSMGDEGSFSPLPTLRPIRRSRHRRSPSPRPNHQPRRVTPLRIAFAHYQLNVSNYHIQQRNKTYSLKRILPSPTASQHAITPPRQSSVWQEWHRLSVFD